MHSIVVQIEGIKSRILTSGPQDAEEAVVFVHGNPGAGDDWEHFLPQVGTFARCIAPDMPGYGKADRPKSFDYTIEGYANYLGALLKQLGISRIHLVLHDFGGAWGMQWAAWHPEQIASVVLVNTGAMPDYRWHKFARIWQTPLLGELFQLCTFRSLLRLSLNRENPKPLPDWFIDRIHADADWGNKRAVLRLYRATRDLPGQTLPLAKAVEYLRLPALVVWGEQDSFLPARYAHTQREYLDAEVHILPSCGHWPMIDDPEQVSRLLVPFLSRQFEDSRIETPG